MGVLGEKFHISFFKFDFFVIFIFPPLKKTNFWNSFRIPFGCASETQLTLKQKKLTQVEIFFVNAFVRCPFDVFTLSTITIVLLFVGITEWGERKAFLMKQNGDFK
jgi:hypothetical protein